MTAFGVALAFALGVALGIRVVAALYGIVDFWYALGTYYPRVLRGLVLWGGATLAVAAALERPYRTAFGFGLLAFGLWYVSLYGLRHLLVRPLARPDADPRPPAADR